MSVEKLIQIRVAQVDLALMNVHHAAKIILAIAMAILVLTDVCILVSTLRRERRRR